MFFNRHQKSINRIYLSGYNEEGSQTESERASEDNIVQKDSPDVFLNVVSIMFVAPSVYVISLLICVLFSFKINIFVEVTTKKSFTFVFMFCYTSFNTIY